MRPFYDSTEFGWIDPCGMQECPEPLVHDRFDIIMGAVQQRFCQRLARVGKRTMTDIVKQGGSNDEPAFFIGKPEPAASNVREVHRPQ
jgi:hypothetical protein